MVVASRASAIIRFDGPALADHDMDVHDLAPSMLALGDLCKIANELFNGNAVNVRVVVRTDSEHKCFQLSFELVQSAYDAVAQLVSRADIKSAKEILEWIGILAGPVALGGLLALYKKIYGKNKDDGTPLPITSVEARSDGDSIIYQIVGDGATINVSPEVHKLAQDPRTLPAVKKLVSPLQNDGYLTIEFESAGKITEYFSRDDAERLISAPNNIIVTKSDKELRSTIRTSVKVRRPAFEGGAAWTIIYKRAIDAKFDDIQWLEDFQSGRIVFLPGWRLVVDLEEVVPINDRGEEVARPSYSIKKVVGVERPPEQIPLIPPTHPRS